MKLRTAFFGLVFYSYCWSAWAFNFSQYKHADLDEILKQPRPQTGVTLVAPQKLMLDVSLISYADDCDTGALKTMMVMQGIPKETVDTLPISKCIKVKTAQGNSSTLYIQDQVAEYLPKEIPLGGVLRVFVDYIFIGSEGPGILLNEFQAPKKP